ncbi:MAG: AraC family transcriptional regulator [Herbinix sp.]|jgi:AraC-like DNA-binding protein|nr:AraC family transcriptional regulator [Herbinix sp.]
MKINTNSKLEEQRNHGRDGFPFAIYEEDYRDYQDHTIGIHWHEEIEFNLVTSGEIDAHIDGNRYHLRAGDGIFINSNSLHMTYSISQEDPVQQYSILFLPEFLAASDTSIFRDSIAPILSQKQLTAFPLYRSNNDDAYILDLLEEAACLERTRNQNNDMELHIKMCTVWLMLHRLLCKIFEANSVPIPNTIHQERTKLMLSYIQRNYNEKINVEDIATSAGISRSECFRCFRNQVKKKPIEYLNEYRLQQAAKELVMTSKSISDIAQDCGFDHQSYFGKQFKEMYQVTPGAYRQESKKPF